MTETEELRKALEPFAKLDPDAPAYRAIEIAIRRAREALSRESSGDDGWKKAFAAQSRKLQAVLHAPGVKEILTKMKWTGGESSGDGERVREALEEARKAVLLLEELCACRGDDEYLAGVLRKINEALRSLSALPSEPVQKLHDLPGAEADALLCKIALLRIWRDTYPDGPDLVDQRYEVLPADVRTARAYVAARDADPIRPSWLPPSPGREKTSPTPVRGDEITGEKEILAELLAFLKIHKAQFYQPGWTNRDRDELMAIMHKGNAAALKGTP